MRCAKRLLLIEAELEDVLAEVEDRLAQEQDPLRHANLEGRAWAYRLVLELVRRVREEADERDA